MSAETLYRDILVGAIEGGTGYWAITEARDYEAITAILIEEGDGTKHEVTGETIARGLDVIATGGVANKTLTTNAHLARTDPGNADVDAELADVIVQAGIFGTIVYG